MPGTFALRACMMIFGMKPVSRVLWTSSRSFFLDRIRLWDRVVSSGLCMAESCSLWEVGCRPVWHGSLQEKLNDRHTWFACPCNHILPYADTLLLNEHSFSIFEGTDPTVRPDVDDIAVRMHQRPERLTIAWPSRDLLQDVEVDGRICVRCAAVQLAPPPVEAVDAGIFIFVDARQVGHPPVFTWVHGGPVAL